MGRREIMADLLDESRQLNDHIRQSAEYKAYQRAKQALYEHEDLRQQLKEFRKRNYELQNHPGYNPYDEVDALIVEYDAVIHNSVVSEFIMSEQKLCRVLQDVFATLTDGLEFDYLYEQ
jgi:cell fate (sporulation/competence/biofilm development) regulator YlbF (YheA/YmcA/DUF963 family)